MKVVGAFEAKNTLGHLLDLVEQGEEVTITRHGKDVARIVPARSRPGREQAHAAIQRIRERAEAAKLGRFEWAEWRAYRDEGRP
jgi:prevent-host-death family protein